MFDTVRERPTVAARLDLSRAEALPDPVRDALDSLTDPLPASWTDLDPAALATIVAAQHQLALAVDCRQLVLAAAWTDAHDRARDPNAGERRSAGGGDGTPQIGEFVCAEFGVLQGITIWAARALIADALDLRCRLPLLWRRVQAGQVRGWQARKVAQWTRDLNRAAAAAVDAEVSGRIAQLPWSRFATVLEAAVIDADPELAARRRAEAQRRRGVWATSSEFGLKTIIAKAAAGDAVWFMATLNRLAEILAAEGDSDPVEVRRSKAIGLIAQPARALAMLLAHRTDLDPADPGTAEDREPDPGRLGDGSGEPPGESGRPSPAETEPHHAGPEQPATRPVDPAVPSTDSAPSTDADTTDHDTTGPSNTDPGALLPRPVRLDLSAPHKTVAALAAAARPQVVLHFHLSDAALVAGHGPVRPERGGPIDLSELRQFLTASGCAVTVRPVLDPATTAPVDGYEIPLRLRAAMRYRHPAEVFPYGPATTPTLDLDHTAAYRPTGPPGQTGLQNLGPLSRTAHRHKTHSNWDTRQPDPGTYLWRSPAGWIFAVTNQGSLNLGNTRYSHAIWRAAAAEPSQAGSSP